MTALSLEQKVLRQRASDVAANLALDLHYAGTKRTTYLAVKHAIEDAIGALRRISDQFDAAELEVNQELARRGEDR